MNPKSSFVISEFTNPSREIVFRVAGWLDGKRVRKNFSTRAEAEAERQMLGIRATQEDTGLRATVTRLTEDQVREAESAFSRLAERKHSLTCYLDYALANYREPEQQKPLVAAITEYVAAKDHEFAQGYLSRLQLTRIKADLRRFETHFRGQSLAQLNVPRLVAFLEMGQPSRKTYNNRRGILSTFFKFSFHRGWVAENPLLKVPHHRLRRRAGMAQTFTVAQARTLMEYMEKFEGGRWVPYFALCLFAGIRPGVPEGEINKLQPGAVNLDTGVINISAEVSKIREPRQVRIQPNLAVWLRTYSLNQFPIVVGNFQQRRAQFAKQLGLTHDVLRHTFISMFVAKFRSLGEAALQAGNSESIIRKHYLDLKTTEEAEQFFGIVPKHAGSAATLESAGALTQASPPL